MPNHRDNEALQGYAWDYFNNIREVFMLLPYKALLFFFKGDAQVRLSRAVELAGALKMSAVNYTRTN